MELVPDGPRFKPLETLDEDIAHNTYGVERPDRNEGESDEQYELRCKRSMYQVSKRARKQCMIAMKRAAKELQRRHDGMLPTRVPLPDDATFARSEGSSDSEDEDSKGPRHLRHHPTGAHTVGAKEKQALNANTNTNGNKRKKRPSKKERMEKKLKAQQADDDATNHSAPSTHATNKTTTSPRNKPAKQATNQGKQPQLQQKHLQQKQQQQQQKKKSNKNKKRGSGKGGGSPAGRGNAGGRGAGRGRGRGQSKERGGGGGSGGGRGRKNSKKGTVS